MFPASAIYHDWFDVHFTDVYLVRQLEAQTGFLSAIVGTTVAF